MEGLKQQYKKGFNRQLDVSDHDYAAFETKTKVLRQLSKAENTPMAIYDMYKDELHFLHWQFDENYPFNHNSTTLENYKALLHPDDLHFVLETEIAAYHFRKTITPDELKDYKLMYECRMKDTAGNYQRLLHQFMVIELDHNGEIWLMLMLLSPVVGKKLDGHLHAATMLNVKTGKTDLFKKDPFLSRREIEIVRLLAQGLDSAAIAQRLFLSLNTVNNHRKNILNKTQTENTAQVLLYVKTMGII
jgi:DNA-binding CsgD family transcriptional regulator